MIAATGLAAALILGAMASAASSEPVIATQITAYDLAEDCRASTGPLDRDFCTGYILAVFDTLAFRGEVCIPQGSATAMAAGVSRKYILDHPERWDVQASLLIAEALKTTFPCK